MAANPRILVVDDETQLRNLVAAVLRRNGFEPLTAEDGAVGLRMAQTEHPDLILCDVEMPQLNGDEVLKALRNDPATSNIPFIIMTGRPDKTSMRAGMAMGADDYLPKPFGFDDLLGAIRGRLHRQRQIRTQTDSRVAQLRADLGKRLPHELLTPLTGILGMAELIRTDYAALQPADILDMVWNIEKSGHRLLHLIQNYLLYAELEAAHAETGYSAFFAEGETASVRNLVEAAARAGADRHSRIVDLVLDVADGAMHIRDELLHKIVVELVDNACKFSQFGTSVQVRSRWEAGQYVLTVQDAGRGMSTEQTSQIAAYRQFDREKYEQQGMGLGLAIVKRLTEIHHGALAIRSQPAVGTTIEVRLPVKR